MTIKLGKPVWVSAPEHISVDVARLLLRKQFQDLVILARTGAITSTLVGHAPGQVWGTIKENMGEVNTSMASP